MTVASYLAVFVVGAFAGWFGHLRRSHREWCALWDRFCDTESELRLRRELQERAEADRLLIARLLWHEDKAEGNAEAKAALDAAIAHACSSNWAAFRRSGKVAFGRLLGAAAPPLPVAPGCDAARQELLRESEEPGSS